MSDRVKGFTVTLQNDIRIDDAEEIMRAILMIKGVLDVKPSITNSSDIMNRQIVMCKIREKFIDFLNEELT